MLYCIIFSLIIKDKSESSSLLILKNNFMSVLISSGINLMLTGMITVFIFLAILIVLINISALLLKDDNKVKENNVTIPLNINSGKLPEEHLKIINHINKRIFNG